MKAVIYQYWEGDLTPGNKAGQELMAEYAEKIGVDHVFEHNPTWPKEARIQRTGLGQYQPHFGAFKPIFDDSFSNYDYILFADTDVIPVETSRKNPRKNIFGEFLGLRHEQAENKQPLTDLWIAEEWMQPDFRVRHNMGGINNANDEKWARLMKARYNIEVPRDSKGRPKVFNSGVVMYSAAAREIFIEKFDDFRAYNNAVRASGLPSFYGCDQPYVHAMMCKYLNWDIMPYKWNSQVHFTPGTSGDNRPVSDYRTEETQFVHLQIRGADHWDKEKTVRFVND